MAKKRQLCVGLDIGSAWTRVVAVSVEDGALHYRAHAAVPSRGWHRGLINQQSLVAESVRQAITDAEAMAGEPIEAVVVGVGGPSVRSQQGRGLYDFGHVRPIEQEDLAYAVELASRARLDPDRVLLQVLPQDFTVDGQPPLPHPLNIDCLRLEAHALLITASTQEHQALLSAVHQAHLRVTETVFEAMAGAYACILGDERASGVALVDVGAHSTNVVYYDGDAMLAAVGLPVSGDHFTRDIGELKALSYEEAERLKFAHGCALLGLSADNIIIELPAEPGRPGRELSRRELIEILQARAIQLFGLVEKGRKHLARDISMREGIVLSGGGANLEGLVEVAEKVMACPARLGFPRGVANWPEDISTPAWTVVAGLAMYAARLESRKDKINTGPSFWSLFSRK